jgi:hypothetical protein
MGSTLGESAIPSFSARNGIPHLSLLGTVIYWQVSGCSTFVWRAPKKEAQAFA